MLTDRVKFIAVKADLESLTKSALKDLSEGLLEVFHDILADLITISRQSRNMSAITNQRHTEEGEEKQFLTQSYDVTNDFYPRYTQLSMVCTGNTFMDLVNLRTEAESRALQNNPGQNQTSASLSDKFSLQMQDVYAQRATDTL